MPKERSSLTNCLKDTENRKKQGEYNYESENKLQLITKFK